MNIAEAIKWAERPLIGGNATFVDGYVRHRFVHYYVIPWNDGYAVVPESQIIRHPDMKWVYNTREKKIREGYGTYKGREYFDSVSEHERRTNFA